MWENRGNNLNNVEVWGRDLRRRKRDNREGSRSRRRRKRTWSKERQRDGSQNDGFELSQEIPKKNKGFCGRFTPIVNQFLKTTTSALLINFF